MIMLENDWLKVSIAHSGAEVREVIHKKNNISYMWTGNEHYWGRVSPVLFPIVGKLTDDQYQLDGETYHMSQHGFLRDVIFDVDDQTTDHVSFIVHSSGRFTDVYPYEFKVIIHYILQKDSLIVQWEVENENKQEMYFSIGAHPAFRIPLLRNETIEDYRLQLTQAHDKAVLEYELKNAMVHEKGVLHEVNEIPLTAALFENDALIYSNIERVRLFSSRSNRGVEVTCQDFPFIGIWSKYAETDRTIAPFICIEPWHGIADMFTATGNFKEKAGINKLAPGAVFQTEYSMKFI